MARRAEELITQKFSLKMIVARHVALYGALLARSRPKMDAPNSRRWAETKVIGETLRPFKIRSWS
jgi:hypothetical protein